MVQDALVREVISPELLEQHLGLHYVHRDVAAKLNPLLTRSLGVESITSDHLIQVGRSLASSWGPTAGEGAFRCVCVCVRVCVFVCVRVFVCKSVCVCV